MDRLVDKLTSYALDLSYDDLPQDVVARTKHIILDSVGCALGAAPSPPATIARTMAAEVSSASPATVMVGGQKTSPDLAAFANGIMIRYLDYNDTYTSKGTCHPSDMLAPTLAAVDSVRGGGKATILGMVLGYEILCGLTDSGAMERGCGWDQATYGILSASVVAAKLLGLNQEQMRHAISLAVSSHLSVEQIRRGQISHWKGCAVANASRNALFCAILAAKGMTGPNDIFEGPGGYFNATGGPFEMPPFGGRGGPFRIMTARVKPFPSGYFSQSAIEAVLELRSKIRSVEAIKEVRVQTFPSGYYAMGSDESRWKPDTRESADHSLPFVMAMALIEGGLAISHYDQEYYKKPETRALMGRIKISVGEEPERAWPEVPLNIVDIEVNTGEIHSTKVAYHRGHFKRLMTDADQERKFRPMAEEYAKLPKEQVDRLLDRLRNLEQVQEIGEMLALTVRP
ncbi:MAG: MmgE/PrpD family protein [Candidatus Methylomirabilales bacterium]